MCISLRNVAIMYAHDILLLYLIIVGLLSCLFIIHASTVNYTISKCK